jgi:hypothetical protein
VEPRHELTKVQRNDLYRSVQKGGLDLVDCDLTQTYKPGRSLRMRERTSLNKATRMLIRDGYPVVHITHLPSSSVFTIEIIHSIYERELGREPSYRYESTIPSKILRPAFESWTSLIEAVQEWAMTVKRTYVDPDLWEELRRGKEFLTIVQREDSANTPFTLSEQTEIADQLQKIKEYMKRAYSFSIEQAAHFDARLDAAEDASKRMGRKDWLLLFGGALLSLILSGLAPPEVVQDVLTMTAHSLGHLFGHAPPPQLPPQG